VGQILEPFPTTGQFKDKQEVRCNEEIAFDNGVGRIFCGDGCGGG
jgi:hypothetical protein